MFKGSISHRTLWIKEVVVHATPSQPTRCSNRASKFGLVSKDNYRLSSAFSATLWLRDATVVGAFSKAFSLSSTTLFQKSVRPIWPRHKLIAATGIEIVNLSRKFKILTTLGVITAPCLKNRSWGNSEPMVLFCLIFRLLHKSLCIMNRESWSSKTTSSILCTWSELLKNQKLLKTVLKKRQWLIELMMTIISNGKVCHTRACWSDGASTRNNSSSTG